MTLPTQARAALDRWIAVRGTEAGPLFVNLHGNGQGDGRLCDRQINRIFKPYGIRPHGLRHASITQALDKTNGDIASVMRFSRHKSPAVLMVYDDRRQDRGGKVAELLDVPRTGAAAPVITEQDLAGLNPTQRETVGMALTGQSQHGIGRALGKGATAIKHRLAAAEKRIPHLRAVLELAGVRRTKQPAGPARSK